MNKFVTNRMKKTFQGLIVTLACVGAGWGLCRGYASAQAANGQSQAMSPFGIGGSNFRTRDKNFATWIPQMEAIGIHETRTLGGTGWVGKVPTNFATLDWQWNYLTSHKMQTGGDFYNYGSPYGLPMTRLGAWAKYVTAEVTHFKGKIKYWEIWNEPPNGTAQGQTAADYARFAVVTYNAAKRADPGCLIGLAAKSVDVAYLARAIKDGAKNHFNYITLHPYEVLGSAVIHDEDSVFMHIVPTVRKMLAALDPSRENCPIIFTELGCAAGGQWAPRIPGFTAPEVQAYSVVEAYAMGIAEGVTCIDWFEGMDGDSGPMGLIAANGHPRPAYTAMAEMIKNLGQHPDYLGWVLLNNGKDYGFVFRGSQHTVMITWAPLGMTNVVHFGQNVDVLDPLTGKVQHVNKYRLTSAPIMVIGVPLPQLTQAATNKSMPFPWGGNYTNAKSVSVLFGKKIEQKGLHLCSLGTIKRQIVQYGGGVRFGNLPGGGTAFQVDENYLCYTPTPIMISAVVRRKNPNRPVSLNILYESTASYAGADKRTRSKNIPAGNGWQTLHWRITNDEFVSCYGYNFILSSSGPYSIKSITITKLTQ